MQSFSLKLSAAIIHLTKIHCGRHKPSEPVFSVVSGSSFVLHSISIWAWGHVTQRIRVGIGLIWLAFASKRSDTQTLTSVTKLKVFSFLLKVKQPIYYAVPTMHNYLVNCILLFTFSMIFQNRTQPQPFFGLQCTH